MRKQQHLLSRLFKLLFALSISLNLVVAQTPRLWNPADTNPNYETQKKQLVTDSTTQIAAAPRTSGAVALPACFEPFGGDGWSTVSRNDDGSFGPVALGWDFSLFGTLYNSVFINTNGNITFNSALGTFTPSGFPIGTPMIAPFWADVDTRNPASGLVYYKVFADRLVVTWDKVGYFASQVDKVNTFQMTIKANTAPGFVGDDVIFAYDDMQWTTGSASGGVSGFGGAAATVGANKGNSIDFIQTGRFNINSSDPPNIPTVGLPGGISWLDGLCLSYKVGGSGNIPPAVAGLPSGNTITLTNDEVRTINLQFSGPETNQNVNIVPNLSGLCNVTATITNNDTPNPTVLLTVTGATCNAGSNIITFTATDNGTPSASQTFSITIVNTYLPPLPTVVTATPPSVCLGETVSLTASCSVGNVIWYNQISGGSSIGSGSPLVLTSLSTGTFTYYASCKDGPVESVRVATNDVVVKELPIASASSTGPYTVGQTIELTATGGTTYNWAGPNSFTSTMSNPNISASTLLNAGIYSVTVTNNACSATATTIVSFTSSTLTTPTGVTGNPNQICLGESVSLNAICTSGTVIWYNQAVGGSLLGTGSPLSITPLLAGTFTYYAACQVGSLESARVASNTVLVKPLPVVTASNTGPYIIDQTIQLNASASTPLMTDTYSWAGPNTFISTLQNPSIPNAITTNAGIYTVTLTSNGCSATATTRVIVNSTNLNWRTDWVKAGTDFQSLFQMYNGITIAATPTLNTGITGTPINALDTSLVKSVRFKLTSNVADPEFTSDLVENIFPFSVYRNLGPQIYGPIFPAGTYKLVTTGFQLTNASGNIVYGPDTLDFTIVPNTFTLALINPSFSTACAGSNIDVTFTASGVFNAANKFEIQLSSPNGTFANPIKIGESTSAGTISCQIPPNIMGGNGYKIRVFATNPALLSNVQMGTIAISPIMLNLQSPADDYSTNVDRKAIETITATNKVLVPANVSYQAGKAIVLNAGFEASSGSIFKAEIQAVCPN